VQVRAAAQVSITGFQKYDAELTLPKLLANRASLNVYGVHHNYPQLLYYGPGADSLKDNRTNYRLEDTAIDVTFSVRPLPRLREFTIAGAGGYVWNNVGPGTSNQWASTEKVFTPAQAIGIDQQTDFLRYGGHAQFDWRDNPGGPRRGGYYLAQVSRYQDRKRQQHDFTRLDLELQQYFPFFNERRVIALRARTTLTDMKAGQTVPFYLQPRLGGPDTLRGYRPFRFADNNSLLMSAEYRYEVFSGLDMAIFADAGKVTARRGQINFKDLESSVGFGFRFNVHNNVFMRVETAFSHEGIQIVLRFNPVFRTGATRTSSSQGEF
jgi:outer membrane protein assembly factor BamA